MVVILGHIDAGGGGGDGDDGANDGGGDGDGGASGDGDQPEQGSLLRSLHWLRRGEGLAANSGHLLPCQGCTPVR